MAKPESCLALLKKTYYQQELFLNLRKVYQPAVSVFGVQTKTSGVVSELPMSRTCEFLDRNLEQDLWQSNEFLHKIRTNPTYAQNVYAALCNMRWQPAEVIPILTDEYWSCSWRSAGGLVARFTGSGDYMDWYCSGIRDSTELSAEEFRNLTAEQQELYNQGKAFVSESQVTDEIREDLLKLGWLVIQDDTE